MTARKGQTGREKMQPYQEEYIENLKEIAASAARVRPEEDSFEAYQAQLSKRRALVEERAARNMELLKTELFPLLDHLPETGQREREELQEFAGKLFQVGDELDTGLFCRIHQALLNVARQKKDQEGMIRELYWVGLGKHNRCSRLIGLPFAVLEEYMSEMRLCFTEAGAYLKYFEQIEDVETRGYIVRARANMALGEFASSSEKIRRVKQTLQILQDPYYQEMEPEIPWEKFIFMTHRQMADSMSYRKDDVVSAEDIEAMMESVYIVYQTKLREAAEKKMREPIQAAFSYNAILYYCGLNTLDALLTQMERLMDRTELSDFSHENMYGMIALPAYYCQFLSQYPERIPPRKEYIESLYVRILEYLEVFPNAPENEHFFLFLRQLSNHFVETADSIPYGEFLLQLLSRFAPDIYVQSCMVGKAAVFFCGVILEEEAGFFDDMEEIRGLKTPEEKRAAVEEYAMWAGLLHDAGKINFMSFYTRTGRQWFEEEYQMAGLHAIVGGAGLEKRASTRRFAPVALGHHSWYDGSHGYPDSYKRLECPCRQMVDVIGLMDWIENVTDAQCMLTGVELTFEEAVEAAIGMEGKRFSPLLTARLQDERIAAGLREAFETGRKEAWERLYRGE